MLVHFCSASDPFFHLFYEVVELLLWLYLHQELDQSISSTVMSLGSSADEDPPPHDYP
jgi:hypothetical protein